jgi:hypothetical protein
VGLSVFSPGKDDFDDDNKLMGLPNDEVSDEESEEEWQDPAGDDFEDDD